MDRSGLPHFVASSATVRKCSQCSPAYEHIRGRRKGGSSLMIGTSQGRLRGSLSVCGVQAPVREHCEVQWDSLSCQVLCDQGVAGSERLDPAGGLVLREDCGFCRRTRFAPSCCWALSHRVNFRVHQRQKQ